MTRRKPEKTKRKENRRPSDHPFSWPNLDTPRARPNCSAVVHALPCVLIKVKIKKKKPTQLSTIFGAGSMNGGWSLKPNVHIYFYFILFLVHLLVFCVLHILHPQKTRKAVNLESDSLSVCFYAPAASIPNCPTVVYRACPQSWRLGISQPSQMARLLAELMIVDGAMHCSVLFVVSK